MTVELQNDYTITVLPGAPPIYALHDAQPGQCETARRLGYKSPRAMNRDHDLTHALLAYWLGLEVSPTLQAVGNAEPATDLHRAEENAVLAIQTFANLMGVSLIERARLISQGV